MLISAAKKLVHLERYLLINIRNEHIIDVDDDACDDDDADGADAERDPLQRQADKLVDRYTERAYNDRSKYD